MGGEKKRLTLKRVRDVIFATLKKIFRIRNWKLALIAILLSFWSASIVHYDGLRMIELRDAVINADKSDDDEATNNALYELRSFVNRHIVITSTDRDGLKRYVLGTGPFYLENKYTRAANEAIARAKEEINQNSVENPNGNIYAKVSEYCDNIGYDYPSQPYLECWVNELAKYPASDTMATSEDVKVPSKELFRYDYASPLWYPCLSGWLIAVTALLLLIVFIRMIYWIIIRIAIIFVK